MAAPVYPGDLNDGDAATAATINDRMQPLYKALNATGIAGSTGITDDHVDAASLSSDRISGTAMTLDNDETASGDKSFSGFVKIQEFRLDKDAKREFGTNSSGANGGSATDDTTPDASGVNWLYLDYGGSTTITKFDNAVEGQILWVQSVGSLITLDHNNGGADSIYSADGADLIMNVANDGQLLKFVAMDDGSGTIKWFQEG